MFGLFGKRKLQDPEMDLGSARCGERLRVIGVREGSTAAMRLLELGFCRSAEVCKLSQGGACLCVLRGMRVAIGHDLAADVLVQRVAAK